MAISFYGSFPGYEVRRPLFIFCSHTGHPRSISKTQASVGQETGGSEAFDKVIVVSAGPALQRDRVLARPGMTVDKFNQILARQLPDADKRERADFVVDTSGTLDETRAQVRNILTCLGLPSGV